VAVLPSLWHGAHWPTAQFTPQGLAAVAFMVLWHVKHIGVAPFVRLTLWVPPMMPKHDELCCASVNLRGRSTSAPRPSRRGT